MKGKSKKTEVFHNLLDPKFQKKAKRPITSVVQESNKINKNDEN